MSQIAAIIAKNMKRLRAARGMRQEALAEKSSLSVDSIRNIETGRAWVSRESVASLAEALRIEEQELFRAESNRPSEEALRIEAAKLLLDTDGDTLEVVLRALRRPLGGAVPAKKGKPAAG